MRGYREAVSRRWVAGLAWVLVAVSAGAQSASLLAPDDRRQMQPMPISELVVQLEIRGSLAHAEVQLTALNPATRPVEGRLTWNVAKGSALYDYELLVGSRYVKAVSVPRQRAREVYEQITRTWRDPGLVEWVDWGVFSTSVSPFPAKSTRSMRFDIAGEMSTEGDELVWELPIDLVNAVDKWKVSIKTDGGKQPVISGLPGKLPLSRTGKLWTGAAEWTHPVLPKRLVVHQPAPAWPQALGEWRQGKRFLAVHDQPELKAVERPPVGRLLVFWDVSGSRAGDDIAGEIELVCGVIDRQPRPSVEVTVVPFHRVLEEPRTWQVQPGQTGEVRRFLEGLRYDGATELGVLRRPESVAAPDLCLVFSDGQDASRDRLPEMGDLRPVWVSPPDVVSTVAVYARLTRGRMVVAGERALDQLLTEQPRLVAIRPNLGTVEEAWPVLPMVVEGVVSVSAKTTGVCGYVTLVYENGDGSRVERECVVAIDSGTLWEEEHSLRENAGLADGAVAMTWVGGQIAGLSRQAWGHEEELRELGTTWGVLTPVSSLMVLETFDDYVRYRVPPPPNFDQARYEREVGRAGSWQRQRETDLVVDLRRGYKERVKWYEREHEWVAEKPEPGKEPYLDLTLKPKPWTPPAKAQLRREDPDAWVLAAIPIDSGTLQLPITRRHRGGFADDDDDDDQSADSSGSAGGTRRARSSGDPTPVGWMRRSKEVQPGLSLSMIWDQLASGSDEALYSRYDACRKEAVRCPSFYLAAADEFARRGQLETAKRVVWNAVEVMPNEPGAWRSVAMRMALWGEDDLAWQLRRQVAERLPLSVPDLRMVGLMAADRGDWQVAREYLVSAMLACHGSTWSVLGLAEEFQWIVNRAAAAGVTLAPLPTERVWPVTVGLRLAWGDEGHLGLHLRLPPGMTCDARTDWDKVEPPLPNQLLEDDDMNWFEEREAKPGRYVMSWGKSFSSDTWLKSALPWEAWVEVYHDFGTDKERVEHHLLTCLPPGDRDQLWIEVGQGAKRRE